MPMTGEIAKNYEGSEEPDNSVCCTIRVDIALYLATNIIETWRRGLLPKGLSEG